jgi:hypothetical protein
VATSSATSRKRLAAGLGLGLDAVGGRAEAVAADVAQLGKGFVQRVLAEVVVVEEAAQVGQRLVDGQQLANQPVLGLGLLLGGRDHGADAGKDLHVVGLAALRHRAGLHLAQEGARVLQRGRMREHRVRVLARQADARVRRAGLEDHRLPLRRALDVQRPRHLEEAPLVVQRVQLVAREEAAALAVAHEGVVVPAVPQALRDARGIRRRSRSAAHARGALRL